MTRCAQVSSFNVVPWSPGHANVPPSGNFVLFLRNEAARTVARAFDRTAGDQGHSRKHSGYSRALEGFRVPGVACLGAGRGCTFGKPRAFSLERPRANFPRFPRFVQELAFRQRDGSRNTDRRRAPRPARPSSGSVLFCSKSSQWLAIRVRERRRLVARAH